MVSPLTTMLMDVSIENRAALLSSLGLAEDDLEGDFLDESSFDAEALAAALKLHKVVTIFAKVLEERYEGEFGTNNDFPTNSSGLIYQALATHANPLNNATNLDNAFNAAESAIRELYADADPEVEDIPSSIAGPEKVAARVNALKAIELIDNLNLDETNFAGAEELVLAVELVAQKMTENSGNVDATITLATDADSGLRTLLSGDDDVDFKGLVDSALSGATNYENYAIPGNAATFADLVGTQLKVSYADENLNGDAYFFFRADEDANTAGTLNTCLRYEDENDVSDDETPGSFLDATWFAIDDRRMVVTLGDGAYNITIISKGPTEGGDLFSLSYGGETRTWESDDGLIADDDENAVTEPTDDASCEALFAPI